MGIPTLPFSSKPVPRDSTGRDSKIGLLPSHAGACWILEVNELRQDMGKRSMSYVMICDV